MESEEPQSAHVSFPGTRRICSKVDVAGCGGERGVQVEVLVREVSAEIFLSNQILKRSNFRFFFDCEKDDFIIEKSEN